MNCDTKRTLALVVRITNIVPIQKADMIELATVLGWNVVVKKNDFKVNDLGIYFTIDSLLDSTKQYSKFLQNKPLKTKKMRGVVSQGLLAPLEWLKEHDFAGFTDLKEGDDLTELMNVTKYVHPAEHSVYKINEGRLPFPLFVPKTDEERVQNIPSKLEQLRNKKVVITKKYDGTSFTCTYTSHDNKFLICSRNNSLIDCDNSVIHFFEMVKKYDLETKMRNLGRNIAIQSEICGPKINGNRLKLKECDLFVFNIYDIDSSKYLLWQDVINITKQLNLKTVDVIYFDIIKDDFLSVAALLELSDAQTYDSGDICEGIVVKTEDPFARISFKVISNKFLLKYNL